MTRPIPRLRAFVSCIFISLIAGCSSAPVTLERPAPEGRLAVFGPGPGFRLDAPPADWIIAFDHRGQRNRAALSTTMHLGVPALEVESGPTATVAVRQVDAMLLATPYLSWSWHLTNAGEGIHPLRMVVGFMGGARSGGETEILGGGLPAHDRAITLVWGDTALRRGALSLPPAERPFQAPVYTVRGGRENTRRWWLETVDLSQLYAQSWPGEDMRNVRVAFIGIAVAPHMPQVRGRVSGIMLSH